MPGENIPENAPDHCPGTQSEDAGKTSACDGCPNKQICSSGEAKGIFIKLFVILFKIKKTN